MVEIIQGKGRNEREEEEHAGEQEEGNGRVICEKSFPKFEWNEAKRSRSGSTGARLPHAGAASACASKVSSFGLFGRV